MSKEIRKKLITGEIDPNNTDLFFGDVIKATISFLNNNIKLRDETGRFTGVKKRS